MAKKRPNKNKLLGALRKKPQSAERDKAISYIEDDDGFDFDFFLTLIVLDIFSDICSEIEDGEYYDDEAEAEAEAGEGEPEAAASEPEPSYASEDSGGSGYDSGGDSGGGDSGGSDD